jgi:GNAT superfamily N-acetyltransferase
MLHKSNRAIAPGSGSIYPDVSASDDRQPLVDLGWLAAVKLRCKTAKDLGDVTGSIIRPAVAADVTTMTRIVRDAYAIYIERIGKPPGPVLDDYERRVREHTAWVLIDGGEIVGVLVLLPADDYLLLDNVAIDPHHQGKGIGRALIDFAEQQARRSGYSEIRLYTHQKMHENIAMYPRLGYEETGRGEQAGYQRVFFRKRLG